MKQILTTLLCIISIKSEVNSDNFLNPNNNESYKDIKLIRPLYDDINKEDSKDEKEFKADELQENKKEDEIQEHNPENEI